MGNCTSNRRLNAVAVASDDIADEELLKMIEDLKKQYDLAYKPSGSNTSLIASVEKEEETMYLETNRLGPRVGSLGGRRMSWVQFENENKKKLSPNINLRDEGQKMFDSDSNTIPYVGGTVSIIKYIEGTSEANTSTTIIVEGEKGKTKKMYIRGVVISNCPAINTFRVRTKHGKEHDLELKSCRWRWSNTEIDHHETGDSVTILLQTEGATGKEGRISPRLSERHAITKHKLKQVHFPRSLKHPSVIDAVRAVKRRSTTILFGGGAPPTSLVVASNHVLPTDVVDESDDSDDPDDRILPEEGTTMMKAKKGVVKKNNKEGSFMFGLKSVPMSRRTSISVVHLGEGTGESDIEAWKKHVAELDATEVARRTDLEENHTGGHLSKLGSIII